MITERIETAKNVWNITYKVWPTSVRVYRVEGDVTDIEALREALQPLAERYGKTLVELRI